MTVLDDLPQREYIQCGRGAPCHDAAHDQQVVWSVRADGQRLYLYLPVVAGEDEAVAEAQRWYGIASCWPPDSRAGEAAYRALLAVLDLRARHCVARGRRRVLAVHRVPAACVGSGIGGGAR